MTTIRLQAAPVLLAALGVLLAGCSKEGSLSGAYGSPQSSDQFVFHSDGTVDIHHGYDAVTTKYTVKGNEMTLFGPHGDSTLFKIDEKGCIYDSNDPTGDRACKL